MFKSTRRYTSASHVTAVARYIFPTTLPLNTNHLNEDSTTTETVTLQWWREEKSCTLYSMSNTKVIKVNSEYLDFFPDTLNPELKLAIL